jgi:cation diffusion facilitator CzcD-associated flavoprotein CzcO
MFKIAIVGLGPAGILALAHLPPEMQSKTVVFEPAALGGALATDYAAVVANLPKSVIVAALRAVPAWAAAPFPHLDKYSDDQCPVLNDVVRQLRDLIAPDLARATFHSARVVKYVLRSIGTALAWQLTTTTGAMFEVQKLVVCTGAVPKVLDLPKPVIPLSAALTPALLPNYITSSDRVVVFGTAHSGTLALKNLRAAGVSRLTALHKGATPFQFARNGYTEGIKQESAAIADDLLATDRPWATLVSLDDFATAHRAVAEATAVVYAIGFDRPAPTFTAPDGTQAPLIPGTTPNVFGFGIGFPALYTAPNGAQYPDVGFGGFVAAIKEALPSLLTFES